jgi:hypothetical protein
MVSVLVDNNTDDSKFQGSNCSDDGSVNGHPLPVNAQTVRGSRVSTSTAI